MNSLKRTRQPDGCSWGQSNSHSLPIAARSNPGLPHKGPRNSENSTAQKSRLQLRLTDGRWPQPTNGRLKAVGPALWSNTACPFRNRPVGGHLQTFLVRDETWENGGAVCSFARPQRTKTSSAGPSKLADPGLFRGSLASTR